MSSDQVPPTIKPPVRCHACLFADDEWEASGDVEERLFVCRRFPPNMLASGYGDTDIAEGSLNFIQPTVKGRNWCGEFKPRAPNTTLSGPKPAAGSATLEGFVGGKIKEG